MTPLGATLEGDGIRFSAWSESASRIWVSLFDQEERETGRVELSRGDGGVFSGFAPGPGEGALYGLRADGPYDPARGLRFDPDKLLIDPYALQIGRPYRYDPRLGAPRGEGGDTAPLMPKCLAIHPPEPLPLRPPLARPGGLIYELNVRAFTMRHPEVPEADRGTLRALGCPAVLDHLRGLGVDAVELMPVTAWMDERHLPPLGLSNAWGYNPVTFMALDPRLAPDGWRDLRDAVAALHGAGIGVILDLVFNHTAESDAFGPTLSLRGLDNRSYFRHAGDDYLTLVNDTGCGNTIDCAEPAVIRMVLDSLRAFVRHAGVDGFRFDLAPVLGRDAHGFRADAPLLEAMRADEIVGSRLLIAEPWDIGPGGYQLGGFGAGFLEWNGRFRDDMRRFWRGDGGMAGALATRLAGSSDVFTAEAGEAALHLMAGKPATRSVNFLAAHDGMTLADIAAYAGKHNLANGEDNRDGHDENLSWNHGVEGGTDDPAIAERRRGDVRAMLATLFLSRGTIMLTAGDEFGRSQKGNNNAYAQDNDLTWLDWVNRDRETEAFARALSAFRGKHPVLRETAFLDDAEVRWLREDGWPMEVADWEDPDRRALAMMLEGDGASAAVAILINGSPGEAVFALPRAAGETWRIALASGDASIGEDGRIRLAPRSVAGLERGDAA